MSKYHIKCCCVGCRCEITTQSLNSHFVSKHTSKEFRGHCVVCDKEVSVNSERFCSRSCSAFFTNKLKDRTLFTPGPKRGYMKKRRRELLKPKFTKISWCPICGTPHPRTGTCSPECKSKLLSNKMKQRIYDGFVPGNNRGRGKQSYMESSFEQWITDNFPNVAFEAEHSFKRKDIVKTYFADFYFPELNLIVELDGSQHEYTRHLDFERDQYIRDNYGVETFRISHKEYQNGSKIKQVESLLSRVSGSNRC